MTERLHLVPVAPIAAKQETLFGTTAEDVYPQSYVALGAALRSVRYGLGLAPSEAAHRLGITREELENAERGHYDFDGAVAHSLMHCERPK